MTFTILDFNCRGVTFAPPTSVTATTNDAGVAEPTLMAEATYPIANCPVNMEVVAGDLQEYVQFNVTAN